jgi:hypothetical protein
LSSLFVDRRASRGTDVEIHIRIGEQRTQEITLVALRECWRETVLPAPAAGDGADAYKANQDHRPG